MKAIAVLPGKPNSVHLAQMPKPSTDDIPGGRGVLVKVLRVGVDGMTKRSTPQNTELRRMATISWSLATRVSGKSRKSQAELRSFDPAIM